MGKQKKLRFLRKAVISAIVIAIITIVGAGLYLWLTLPDVSGLVSQNPETTALIRLRESQAKKAGKKYAAHRTWTSLEKIPELFKKAVLVSEDAAFYDHKGIDFVELKESIKRDIKEKKFSRGGSTITQQLAKNLYLSSEKSLLRKIKEALIAKRLERHLTKNRIFSLYLNIIEFGPEVFGVQAAARHWFGKDVGDLSLEEIVRLTAIIPRPLTADPRMNSSWMKFKGPWIARTLKVIQAIDETGYDALVRAFE